MYMGERLSYYGRGNKALMMPHQSFWSGIGDGMQQPLATASWQYDPVSAAGAPTFARNVDALSIDGSI